MTATRALTNAVALVRLVMRANPSMTPSDAARWLLDHEPALKVEPEHRPRRFKKRR